MNALRSHLTTLINKKQTLLQTELTDQFKKMVLQRIIAANILAFLIQYIGLRMSTLDSLFAPLWIASGTACALIFLRGTRVLPGIGLGSGFAYYFANCSSFQAMLCASLLTLQAYVLLRLSYRYVHPTLVFYQRNLFITFILLSTIITATSSYFLTIITYSSIQSDFTRTQIWLLWWFANLNGLIIFSCSIMTWDAYFPQTYQVKKQLYSLMSYFGPMILLSLILLFPHHLLLTLILSFLLFSLTLAISRKFKWCGIIAALFIQGLILSIATFCMPTIIPSNFQSVLSLQLFILLEIVLGMLLTQSKITQPSS
jgi:hypothetical protein